jgi:hypothetical protein
MNTITDIMQDPAIIIKNMIEFRTARLTLLRSLILCLWSPVRQRRFENMPKSAEFSLLPPLTLEELNHFL